MALFNLTELVAALPAGVRLIGLDPGRKRIGVALSDATRRLAGPYATLPRGKLRGVAEQLRAIAIREEAGALVVGWPLEMDGTIGPSAQAARDWALALSEATALPAALWDERMSTATVLEQMLEADVSRSRRSDAADRMAAAHILQTALDALAGK
jgi:putative holliday junction resolvase